MPCSFWIASVDWWIISWMMWVKLSWFISPVLSDLGFWVSDLIHMIVNRINLHPVHFESIHHRSESYQSTCFFLLVFSLFELNHTLSESIQHIILAKILHLPPFSIYTHILTTTNSLNHLHLFSLKSTNLIVHLFLRLNIFSKNLCGLLSHRLLYGL